MLLNAFPYFRNTKDMTLKQKIMCQKVCLLIKGFVILMRHALICFALVDIKMFN